MTKVNVDHSKYENIRFDIQEEDVILTHILETIPYEYPGKPTWVEIPTNEFTSVCPWSGLPDFADITVSYIPNEKLIEMKSLKFYLTSFRNVGIYQEHATNRILEDLVKVCDPIYMKIEAYWNARGGLGTRIVVEYDKEQGRVLRDIE
ncbi:preQ(1) synthase [Microaerobacter geothermalis]|uniref:preQ(1) synthase n=1 Tax=Microaerobacter geothermalis TaxID=674972 RepID=UPI001F1FBBA7|nr:preQ(1) synthase [Microaerobacter geothermalis]MCF6094145.1 preQ(1) synthase [Microaerobacter geothermalis]